MFFVFLVVDQLSDLTMVTLASRHINNLWLTHVFVLIQYAFFSWIFAGWQHEERIRKLLYLSIPGMILLGIISAFFLENVTSFNTITRPLSSLLIVMISAYTLLSLNRSHVESLFRDTRFWLCSAALIYFASSLALAALGNVIIGLPLDQSRQLFAVHAVLNVIANVGYAGAFLCLIPLRKSGVA